MPVPVDALALTLSGFGGFLAAVLVGAALLVIAIRGIRVHIDKKER